MKITEHPGKTLRDALALSQAEFAEALGITQPAVSYAESGANGYGKRTILAIMEKWRRECLQLGITAEDLARGVDTAA